MQIENPNQLKWKSGPPPDVKTVPRDCRVIIWITHHNSSTVVMIQPWENPHNFLTWIDQDGYPLVYMERATYWAWFDKGNLKENWQKEGF